jgi:hypothetical protein
MTPANDISGVRCGVAPFWDTAWSDVSTSFTETDALLHHHSLKNTTTATQSYLMRDIFFVNEILMIAEM